ncbi:hypothetical protein KAU18_05275 [Candidatus Bathyarchaeota archaeon]|nr:hypothetical protein [Candidatus Bathyarchaeota archaeon]
MIKVLDIAANLLASLENGMLSEDEALHYFMDNQRLLRSNIEQAYAKYGEEDLVWVVRRVFPEIIGKRELILSNQRRLTEIKDQVSEKVVSVYGSVPEVVIVPCVGLFVASGWASKEGGHHVFIALEFPHRNMDIILAHEVAHAVSQDTWDTVLDGFYREGHAAYVSSVLFPRHGDEEYLFMSKELYHKCLEWMEANREKILIDSIEPLKVLNRHHKFYFTTGYSPDYPNIGYVIGYHYVKHLNRKHSLPELLDFGLKKKEKETEFEAFINDADSFTEGR